MSTPGIRSLAWHFVAGEDLESALAVLRELDRMGVRGTINLLGTHVTESAEAVAGATEIAHSLREARDTGLEPNISVKLTRIGLDVDLELCLRELRRILDVAREVDGFVWIDMEESRYIGDTIATFHRCREEYGNERLGLAWQSYIRGANGALETELESGSRVRLVKGGYWESADVVFRATTDIDSAFYADIERALSARHDPAIATHDPVAVERAAHSANVAGLGRTGFEFQMLYGVRPDLRDRLVADGFVVRCYVPYGGNWYEYLLGCIRRSPRTVISHVRRRFDGRGRRWRA